MQGTIEPPRPPFEPAYETKQIVDLIRERVLQAEKLPVDITYDDLSAAADCEINGRSSYLRSAYKILQREDHRVVRAIRCVGVRVHDTQGIFHRQFGHINRQRRAAYRARKEGKCMQLHELPPPQRARALINESLFGLIENASRERKLKKLEAKFPQPKLLSLGEMLESLKS